MILRIIYEVDEFSFGSICECLSVRLPTALSESGCTLKYQD